MFKTASASVAGFAASVDSRGRTASRVKVGSFEYEPAGPDYLYVSLRALSADRPNLNMDMFPSDELREAHKTFVGSCVFLEHDNRDPEKSRGAIIASRFHEEDPDDRWVEILMELDERRCPKLCSMIRSGEINTFSMGCFAPGTAITLGDGTKRNIEDIRVGDEVLTIDGTAHKVSETMVHQHSGVLYQISSYAGGKPMLLTDEHPVWVRRPQHTLGETVRRKREKNKRTANFTCTCGRSFESHRSLASHIREAKRHGFDGEHGFAPEFEGWVQASDIEVGDYVLSPKVACGHQDVSVAFATLLGYYLAEGNFLYDRNRRLPDGTPCGVEWTFGEKETEYHQEVMELVKEIGYSPVGPYFKNGAATIRCNSPELASLMLEYGGKYSWGKKINQDVFDWPEESRTAVLIAYFNGDAHWDDEDKKRHFEFRTVSKQLAEQIYALCSTCGIMCSVPRGYEYDGYVHEAEDGHAIGGKRPVWTAQGVIGSYKSEANPCAYKDEKGIWRKVTQVRLIPYDGPVYNFEVEESHTYVAESVAVHNCEVDYSECPICGKTAEQPWQFCEHMRNKGREYGGKLAYEICHGIDFFEESVVYNPADPTARAIEVSGDRGDVAPRTGEWFDELGTWVLEDPSGVTLTADDNGFWFALDGSMKELGSGECRSKDAAKREAEDWMGRHNAGRAAIGSGRQAKAASRTAWKSRDLSQTDELRQLRWRPTGSPVATGVDEPLCWYPVHGIDSICADYGRGFVCCRAYEAVSGRTNITVDYVELESPSSLVATGRSVSIGVLHCGGFDPTGAEFLEAAKRADAWAKSREGVGYAFSSRTASAKHVQWEVVNEDETLFGSMDGVDFCAQLVNYGDGDEPDEWEMFAYVLDPADPYNDEDAIWDSRGDADDPDTLNDSGTIFRMHGVDYVVLDEYASHLYGLAVEAVGGKLKVSQTAGDGWSQTDNGDGTTTYTDQSGDTATVSPHESGQGYGYEVKGPDGSVKGYGWAQTADEAAQKAKGTGQQQASASRAGGPRR